MRSWMILVFSLSFWVIENQFFGWNLLPRSVGEVLADGFVVALAALAVAVNDWS